MSYAATASALDVHFSDGNGTGDDANRQYIIGQHVTAGLVSPLTVSGDLTWTTSGGTPFSSYVRSSASAVLNPLPAPNHAVDFSGYYAKSGGPTLECQGTLSTPSGSVPDHLDFDISRTLTTTLPSIGTDSAAGKQGGSPISSPNGLSCFGLTYTDPYIQPPLSNVRNCGVYFSGTLSSSGKFYFVQLTTMARSRSGPAGSQIFQMPLNTNPQTYYSSGLDTIFPGSPSLEIVTSGYYDQANVKGYDSDSPFQEFEPPATDWTSYSINGESFETYLMYQPPGESSMDVPFGQWTLSWTCSGSYVGPNWDAPNTDMAAPQYHGIENISHPTWNKVVNGFNGVWHS
jgi:hypothetical protein